MALGYLKHFINEKKKHDQVAVDEYRKEIQKSFDLKQKEFFDKNLR